MYELKILYIILIQNCFQFDTLTMILGKRVKNQGFSEEENDFIIGSPMNHSGATYPHEGIDISKSCFFSLTP